MSKNGRTKEKNKKVKRRRLGLLFLIIAVAFIIITIRFYTSIINTKMLPTTFIVAITIVEVIITFILVLGLVKKHKTLKLNIFCLLIIIVTSSAYIFANHYIDKTMDWLKSIFGANLVEVEEYYVVVRKDSEYNQLDDIRDKKIEAFLVESDVKEKIQNNVNAKIDVGEDLLTLGSNLLEKKIDIILVSSSQYDMITEAIEEFKNNTKIIAKETHILEQQAKVIEDENSQYTIGNGVFNIYVSGMDVFGNINKVARTDANILVTVNLNTHQILLTSIPRDYYVTLHSKKSKDKLTHSGIYGITETVTTIEDFLDIDINYYVRVNFSTVIKMIDAIGGVDVESDYNFTVNDPWEYKRTYKFVKGTNHLSGEAALAFSRERNSFKDGDNQRVKNQQKVIEALMNKVLSSKTILNKYTNILDSLSGSFNTNMSQDEISAIVNKQLSKMPTWTINHISLTGSDAVRTTYSMGSQELYVMLPNQNSVKDAKDEIQKVMGKK